LGEPDKALECYRRSLEIREALLAASDTPQHRRELRITLNRIGNLLKEGKQPEEATEIFQRSLDLSEAEYGHNPNNRARKDFLHATENLTAQQRKANPSQFAQQDEQWSTDLWQLFRQKIWRDISEDAKNEMRMEFPQAEIVAECLEGKDTPARPTLGFTIAACQHAQQPHLLYTFIDFQWWSEKATPEQRDAEQLETLNRDDHEWGIVRKTVSEEMNLPPHPQISEEMQSEAARGLSCTISLSFEEKQRVVKAWPTLSNEQITELLRIFKEEQAKFALLDPAKQFEL
jgi:tetratricopeptide (TPR) repeat protein